MIRLVLLNLVGILSAALFLAGLNDGQVLPMFTGAVSLLVALICLAADPSPLPRFRSRRHDQEPPR